MFVLGEIRTCLLQNSGALPRSVVSEILELLPGARVRISERPVAHAVSPDLITGVDCQLPVTTGARSRAVGTVSARAVVTGGLILQGSVHVRLERGELDRRLPWSHYLAKPGVVETIGKTDWTDVGRGFFAAPSPESSLDLGAVSERLIGSVQMNRRLDHTVPFRCRRTRMRWAATVGDTTVGDTTVGDATVGDATVGDGSTTRYGGEFTVEDDTLRTLRLRLEEDPLPAVVNFCEDLAMHDWVLTTLLQLVERSNLGSSAGPEAITRLRPAIDHLLHLWMPGARVSRSLLPLWDSLEQRPGFTRQWQSTVVRIRDQLALHTLTALGNLRLDGSGSR